MNAILQDDGAVPLSAHGSYLRSFHPAFDPRLYGVAKLSDLVRQRYLTVTGAGSAAQVREVKGADEGDRAAEGGSKEGGSQGQRYPNPVHHAC